MLEIERKLMGTVNYWFPNIEWEFKGNNTFGCVESEELAIQLRLRFTMFNETTIDLQSNGMIWARKSLIYEVAQPFGMLPEGVSLEFACECVQAELVKFSKLLETIASSIKEVE